MNVAAGVIRGVEAELVRLTDENERLRAVLRRAMHALDHDPWAIPAPVYSRLTRDAGALLDTAAATDEQEA